jgi:hypothetical protein
MHAIRDKQDTLSVSYVEKQRPECDAGKSEFDRKLRVEMTYAGIASRERLGNRLRGHSTDLASDHVGLLQNCLVVCDTNWLTDVGQMVMRSGNSTVFRVR